MSQATEVPRLSIAQFLSTDICNWVGMGFKDRRKASIWLCKACGKMGKGRKQPPCPARSIIAAEKGPRP